MGLARHQARANCEGATPFVLQWSASCCEMARLSSRSSASLIRLSLRDARLPSGNGFARLVFGRQNAAGQRAVADDADAVRLAQRQQLHLDIAIDQVVERLHGGEARQVQPVAGPQALRTRRQARKFEHAG